MKKIILSIGFLALFFAFAGSAKAATLNLLSFNGGEEYLGGQTYELKWTQSNIKSILAQAIDEVSGTSAANWNISLITVDSAANTGSYQLSIPKTPYLSGKYRLELIAYLATPEGDIGNIKARSSSSFTISQEKPDIVINDVIVGLNGGFSGFVRGGILQGADLAFQFDLSNLGGEVKGNTYKLYVEGDGIKCYSSVVSNTFPIKVTCQGRGVNAPTTLGKYTVKATVDYNNEIDESNEANNTKIISFDVLDRDTYIRPIKECTPAKKGLIGQEDHESCVDMNVESIVLSKERPIVNEAVTITVTAINDPSGGVLYAENGAQYKNNFLDFMQTAVTLPTGSIRQGDKFKYIFKGYFTSVGEKKLSIYLDPLNKKDEISESNNEFTKIIWVVPSSSPTTENNGASSINFGASVAKIDHNLSNRLKGRILLQAEQNGEAWYVRPDNGKKMYMKDGAAAYDVMRNLGLGISNADLAKIPIGFEDKFQCADSDSDGLCNKLEEGIGTDPNDADSDGDGYMDGEEVRTDNNPLGMGKLALNTILAKKLSGKIVLQVQSHGEAWYINPVNGKRYYMPDGAGAYQIMRSLSLGIKDADLRKIGYDGDSAVSYDWKKYENKKYGYSFMYPSGWDLSEFLYDQSKPLSLDYTVAGHPHKSTRFSVCPDAAGLDCPPISYPSYTTTESNVNLLGKQAVKVDYKINNTSCDEFGCETTYTFQDRPVGWSNSKDWHNNIDILLAWYSDEERFSVESILSTFKFLEN